MVHRLHQAILIGSVLLGSWWGMQAVHEFGHMLGAWLTGGQVARVVLHPLAISRTDLAENPSPLVVAWSGPLWGVVMPLLLFAAATAVGFRWTFLTRFFAGFCLIANGLYMGIGVFGRVGDCGDLLRHGAADWQLWLFGLLTVPFGLALWHGLGPRFGLGDAQGRVDHVAACVALATCLALAGLGFATGGHSSGPQDPDHPPAQSEQSGPISSSDTTSRR